MDIDMTSQTQDFNNGTWWKFPSYEVVDGYVRPARGHKPSDVIEYNPWKGFSAGTFWGPTSQSKSEATSLYAATRKLITEIDAIGEKRLTKKWFPNKNRRSEKPKETSPHSQARIQKLVEEWCNRFGLFGLLLHQVHEVRFEPHVMKQPTGFFAAQVSASRFSRFKLTHQAIPLRGRRSGRADQGSLTAGERELLGPGCDSFVHFMDIMDQEMRHESLEANFIKYFPDIEEHSLKIGGIPQFYSKEFWYEYAEPIDMVTDAICYLADAFIGVYDGDTYLINHLLEPSALQLNWRNKDKIDISWWSPSLLGTFAQMAAIDFQGSGQPRVCTQCRLPFAPHTVRAHYCSDVCREAGERKKLRARIKEAQSLAEQGFVIEAISEKLGASLDSVRSWVKRTQSGPRPSRRIRGWSLNRNEDGEPNQTVP